MDWEKVIKDLQDEIVGLKSKIEEYEQKDLADKIEEYTQLLEAKETELKITKEAKEEAAATAKKMKDLEEENKMYAAQLNELAHQTKVADVQAYVQAHNVQGDKRILPKHEALVTQILLNCPDVKEYAIDGVSDKMSLADMVKRFISELPALVDTSERSKGGLDTREYGDSARAELAQRTTEYMAQHKDIDYAEAMKAVLSADADLKARYFEYTMGVCE